LETATTRRTAALLLIGNELLTGKVQDQNFSFLARELYALGVDLVRVVVIVDEVETIAQEVSVLSQGHDFVFTSGGVGPTHDDVTYEGVARAFGTRVSRNKRLEEILRSRYGEGTNEGHLRMADTPEGVELVFAADLRWPALLMRNVYILPGIPEFFRMKFEALRPLFRGVPFVLAQIFLRCDETNIAEPLREIAAGFPDVQIGSYPRVDEADHRVKLTIESRDAERVTRALEALLGVLPAGEIVKIERPE
jgi:molybdenum cofactor synthesis domain-containing protein